MGGLTFAVLLTSVILFDNKVQAVLQTEKCENVDIVSRSEWRARDPIRERKMHMPVNHVVISHTVTWFCKSKPHCIRNVKFIQDMHLDDRGWWDIAYNFLIGGDGNVYEGRGWSSTGSHTVNYNTISLGISFIGNFNKDKPTTAMINATKNLIKCGVEKGFLTPMVEIHGHKDATCTESPGSHLYPVIRHFEHFKGGRLPGYFCKRLEIPVVNKDIIND